jgi:transposase
MIPSGVEYRQPPFFLLFSLLSFIQDKYKIFMNIIGFDVSKSELVGVKINKGGVVKETYSIENTKEAIDTFLNDVTKVTIGCEATAEYHNVLARSCIERNLPCRVLNPIVTKQFTRATVRRKKTDLSDAEVIAKCVLQGEGQEATLATFSAAKRLLRTSSELTRLSVSVSHMRKTFAEHWKEEVSIQATLHELEEHIAVAVKAVRAEGMASVDESQKKLLASIPGIGDTLAATILAEVGDVARFPNAPSLVAYAGLDPRVRQSGISLHRNAKLTKRGSPYLRRALFIAASIGQRHDPFLKAYYEKKRLEGKRYKEATVANARHMMHRVHAVLKRGTPYVIHT